MTLEQIHQAVQSSEYDFLRNHERLGDKLILLGLGGSHAYGSSNETSDLDIRGITARNAKDILIGRDFEQVTDKSTDTVIYSFNKMIKLLSECNPNTIEILGLKPEHYLYMTPVGEALIANADMFLSKLAVHKFGAYASSQLRRLENKAVRGVEQMRREEHILRSIEHASFTFREKYAFAPEDAIRLFTDVSNEEGFDSEIFMDLNLQHYPLRDWVDMWAEMKNIASSYSKLGMRNANAIEHDKLGKHQMHLVRLYLMAFDILEQGKIITYREKDQPFLMDIREGKYLNEDKTPTAEFREIVDELENRLSYDAQHTELPDKPDYDRINAFKAEVNYEIVRQSSPLNLEHEQENIC